MKILVLNFWKRAYFQDFSGIASSMKMLSKNIKSRTCVYICVYTYYIGGLMEYISQKVAICSSWTVCPCFYFNPRETKFVFYAWYWFFGWIAYVYGGGRGVPPPPLQVPRGRYKDSQGWQVQYGADSEYLIKNLIWGLWLYRARHHAAWIAFKSGNFNQRRAETKRETERETEREK